MLEGSYKFADCRPSKLPFHQFKRNEFHFPNSKLKISNFNSTLQNPNANHFPPPISTSYNSPSLHLQYHLSIPPLNQMAVSSLCGNNGDKENIPSSSSVNPLVPFSAVSPKKKRKLRMPLEDITNLLYPGSTPSLRESPSLVDTASVFLLACLIYQVKNRCKRVDPLTLRNSSAAAATLRKHFR